MRLTKADRLSIIASAGAAGLLHYCDFRQEPCEPCMEAMLAGADESQWGARWHRRQATTAEVLAALGYR